MSIVDYNGKSLRSDIDQLQTTAIITQQESRIKPRLTGTGVTRGTQTIGYGRTKLDGSNDRVVLSDGESVLTIGDISDDDDSFGIGVTDNDGLEMVRVGKTSDDSYGLSAYDDDIMRMHFGKYPDGTVKGKLSQPGINVLEATDSQLIWSTDFNSFKIVLSGTVSLEYDGVATTFVTIPHGLTTIPIVNAYAQLPNTVDFSPMGGQYVPMPFRIDRAGLPSAQGTQSADATNIYLRVHDIYSGIGTENTYNFRYYALQETAA